MTVYTVTPNDVIYNVINQMVDGDTLQVTSGTYNQLMKINKPMTVIGIGTSKPVFTGIASSTIEITFTKDVIIDNLDFKEWAQVSPGCAVTILTSDNVTVQNCRFSRGDYPRTTYYNSDIYCIQAKNGGNGGHKILNNVFYGHAETGSMSPNVCDCIGVYPEGLYSWNNSLIKGNKFYGGWDDCIELDSVGGNTIIEQNFIEAMNPNGWGTRNPISETNGLDPFYVRNNVIIWGESRDADPNNEQGDNCFKWGDSNSNREAAYCLVEGNLMWSPSVKTGICDYGTKTYFKNNKMWIARGSYWLGYTSGIGSEPDLGGNVWAPYNRPTEADVPGTVISDGKVNITCNVETAEIYLNDKPVSVGPYTAPIGHYEWRASAQGYNPDSGNFDITVAGQIYDLNIVLELLPEYGTLKVTLTPKGTKLYMDNILIGAGETSIKPGSHYWKATYAAYTGDSGQFEIGVGETYTLDIILRFSPLVIGGIGIGVLIIALLLFSNE